MCQGKQEKYETICTKVEKKKKQNKNKLKEIIAIHSPMLRVD